MKKGEKAVLTCRCGTLPRTAHSVPVSYEHCLPTGRGCADSPGHARLAQDFREPPPPPGPRADYAYGDSGSPPKIPGGATLDFEVELLSWKSVKDIAGASGRRGGAALALRAVCARQAASAMHYHAPP